MFVDCRDLPGNELVELLEFILPVVCLRTFVFIVGREDVGRLGVILVELRLGWLITGALAELFRITGLGAVDLVEGWLALGLGWGLLCLLLAGADCCARGAGAGREACCFAAEELLDFLLFLAFCAETGSVVRIKAEASTMKANVSFCWCFGLYMIKLLSIYFLKRFFSIHTRHLIKPR